VPDEPVPDPAAEPRPVPSDDDDRLVEDEALEIGPPQAGAPPVSVRRAPRFGSFVTAGVLAGAVLGVVLATVFDTGALTDDGGVLPFLGGANGARAVSALVLGGLGALVGAGLALWSDARSRRAGQATAADDSPVTPPRGRASRRRPS
jgi:hypothetical protein